MLPVMPSARRDGVEERLVDARPIPDKPDPYALLGVRSFILNPAVGSLPWRCKSLMW